MNCVQINRSPLGHPYKKDNPVYVMLEWVCWKRDVYFAKVDKDGTSQECSQCGAHTGKKTLDVRVHHCRECGYIGARDVVSAEVIRNRGLSAVGTLVDIKQNACGDDLTGVSSRTDLVKSLKQESPAIATKGA